MGMVTVDNTLVAMVAVSMVTVTMTVDRFYSVRVIVDINVLDVIL